MSPEPLPLEHQDEFTWIRKDTSVEHGIELKGDLQPVQEQPQPLLTVVVVVEPQPTDGLQAVDRMEQQAQPETAVLEAPMALVISQPSSTSGPVVGRIRLMLTQEDMAEGRLNSLSEVVPSPQADRSLLREALRAPMAVAALAERS
jgi:hypothetical protein